MTAAVKREYELRPLDPESLEMLEEAADMHMRVLPRSPFTAMGRRWLSHFYFRILPGRKDIVCTVCYRDEKPVGFLMATTNREGGVRRALQRHWFDVVTSLAASLVESPRRLSAASEALTALWLRKSGPQIDILAIAVPPALHRTVAQLLLDSVTAQIHGSRSALRCLV